MTTEMDARTQIDIMLREAGWKLYPEKEADVRTEGNIPNPTIKKALNRKRPDYHLYQDPISPIPLAFIEAKKPGITLDQGLYEGKEKVQLALGKTPNLQNMLLFVTDGTVTIGVHSNGQPLRINDISIEEIPNKETVLQLLQNPNIITGQTLQSAEQLIQLFKMSSNSFREDGLTQGIEQLLEFSKILFLKIMSERQDQDKGKTANRQWREIIQSHGQEMLRKYQEAVESWRTKYGEIFSEARIENPETLANFVIELDSINFTQADIDIKGNAYEWFLTRYSSQPSNDLGQYFTPRHITQMMAQILDPQLGDRIYDPFCGTAGMLISCYKHMARSLGSPNKNNINEYRTLNKKMLYGSEITKPASALAKMNMIIIGDGHSNIIKEDSLKNPQKRKYDKVITNIPFGKKLDAHKYTLHCFQAIQKGGKATIILPATIALQKQYAKTREFIEQNSRILGVIHLPGNLFQPYTAARTILLITDKIHQATSATVPVTGPIKDGYTNEKNRKPTNGNDIPNVVAEMLSDKSLPDATHINLGQPWIPKPKTNHIYGKYYQLRDVLKVRTKTTQIDPNKTYNEPRLSSTTNTVSPLPKLGIHIKNKSKIIAKPGDLIIATLHTQTGNGLFAFADQEYIIESQIAAEVKTDLVSPEYLKAALQFILPKLENVMDLVGRETYPEEQILNAKIPHPDNHPELAKKIQQLANKKAKIASEIDELKSEIGKLIT